jgi:hypothetical protein
MVYHLYYSSGSGAFSAAKTLKDYHKSFNSDNQWVPFVHYLPLKAWIAAAELVSSANPVPTAIFLKSIRQCYGSLLRRSGGAYRPDIEWPDVGRNLTNELTSLPEQEQKVVMFRIESLAGL